MMQHDITVRLRDDGRIDVTVRDAAAVAEWQKKHRKRVLIDVSGKYSGQRWLLAEGMVDSPKFDASGGAGGALIEAQPGSGDFAVGQSAKNFFVIDDFSEPKPEAGDRD